MVRAVLVVMTLFLGSMAADASTIGCPSVAVVVPSDASSNVLDAVEDVADLLDRALTCGGIGPESADADVIIRLRKDDDMPGESFRVTSSMLAGVLEHVVTAPESGLAHGLYALLQERLGFSFVHPRQTVLPDIDDWPLDASTTLSGSPRFSRRGFHLHTMHPTELTVQLHDPNRPGAFDDIAEYIDWLARTGQNTFQFYLQRGIDPEAWPPHARRIIAYAHERGIEVGVMVSVSKLQQHAFQLVRLLRPNYLKQARNSVDWLMQAPWDFVVLDTPVGEYLPDLAGKIDPVIDDIERRLMAEYGVMVLYATHVIRDETRILSNILPKRTLPRHNGVCSGVLVHTVMCYSLFEPTPNVYANENFQHMLALALEDVEVRETWYWPESAYWVAFDNSVPVLLLGYLDSRLTDILAVERLGVDGHVTFSSGWEWGYWLIDWSIARWSWDYGVSPEPMDGIRKLAGDDAARVWSEALAVQNRWLKGEDELMSWLAALDPMAEFPAPFDFRFQPRPSVTGRGVLHRMPYDDARSLIERVAGGLEDFAGDMGALEPAMTELSGELMQELADAAAITRLRALHRAATLRALGALKPRPFRKQPLTGRTEAELERARNIRMSGDVVVERREAAYRYPVSLIARKRPGITAYGFGYLYPVAGLSFWEREERQVEQRRFNALFETIWPMWDVFGLPGLFFGETYRPAD